MVCGISEPFVGTNEEGLGFILGTDSDLVSNVPTNSFQAFQARMAYGVLKSEPFTELSPLVLTQGDADVMVAI